MRIKSPDTLDVYRVLKLIAYDSFQARLPAKSVGRP